MVIFEQKIPDYFTRANTKLLEAKGFLSAGKKTIVYQSVFTQLINLQDEIVIEKKGGFQQVSAQIIDDTTKHDYATFKSKFSSAIDKILLERIEQNMLEIVSIYK